MKNNNKIVIAFGSSTGGVQVIENILTKIKGNVPPILVTQHMPEGFTASFAKRLNDVTCLDVKEAEDGELIKKAHVYIAPGGKHMLLKNSTDGCCIQIEDGPKVSRHKPSVDVLFESVSESIGENGVGFIMTGMGGDGAIGLKKMKDAGGLTYAQDKDSCIVYGMPRVAVKLGAVDKEISLDEIVEIIMKYKEE